MRLTIACVTAATLLAACEESPPGMVPDNPPRALPATGIEEPFPRVPYDGGPVDVAPIEELTCCDVTFAIAADQDEGEVEAYLYGSDLPLADGVRLERVADTWSGSVCIPAGFDGSYYYDVGLDIGTGTPFYVRRTNESAPAADTASPSNALQVPEDGTCPPELAAHGS